MFGVGLLLGWHFVLFGWGGLFVIFFFFTFPCLIVVCFRVGCKRDVNCRIQTVSLEKQLLSYKEIEILRD